MAPFCIWAQPDSGLKEELLTANSAIFTLFVLVHDSGKRRCHSAAFLDSFLAKRFYD